MKIMKAMIRVKVGSRELELTPDEAQALYQELASIFRGLYVPVQVPVPAPPAWQPWEPTPPSYYPIITC